MDITSDVRPEYDEGYNGYWLMFYAAKRLALAVNEDGPEDTFYGYSSGSGDAGVEGTWREWVTLAEYILGHDNTASAAPALHAAVRAAQRAKTAKRKSPASALSRLLRDRLRDALPAGTDVEAIASLVAEDAAAAGLINNR